MAAKAMKDRSTEELKNEALESLRTCLSNLLRGTLAVHQAIGIMLLTNPERSAAAGNHIDEAASYFRGASENLRYATSAWETVVQRGKKK